MDITHNSVIEYICASKELTPFLKRKQIPPSDLSNRYDAALQGIRNYLDGLGLFMPKALYPLDPKIKRKLKFYSVKLA